MCVLDQAGGRSRGGPLFQDVAPAKKPNGIPQLVSLVEPHKRTALSCCRVWPRLLGELMGPERFSGATRKERLCFAAERGPGLFGHTLEGPFCDPKPSA